MINVCKRISQFCVAKGVKTTRERIKVTAKCALVRYDESEILKALDELVFTCEFFPDVAKISKQIESSKPKIEDMANELAGAIIEALTRFSHLQAAEVREYIGETGWHVLERFGGWTTFCSITTRELPSIRAQLRDLCKACFAAEKRNPELTRIPYQKEGMRSLTGELKKLSFDKL